MKLLNATVIGSGFPIVILHGYFGMGENWKMQSAKFLKDFEVHLVDQRNHGKSFHTDAFSYDLMVEDLKYYFDQKGLKKAFILGHSMGGKTAMSFAVEYPEYVEKMVVVDIAPKYYAPHHQVILDGLNGIDFSKYRIRSEVYAVLKQTISDEAVCQFLLKNVYRKEGGEMEFCFNLKSLIQNNEKIGESLPKDKIYDGDVLFLKGSHSDYISDEDISLIKYHFKEAKLEEIPDSGHWLQVDNPEAFYKKTIEFLKL